jgi:putative SOS response-associated peptidase YedK
MCGRFTQTQDLRVLIERFGFTAPGVDLAPRYNIAPGQSAAIVRSDEGGRALELMRWGLVPHWARDEKIGFKLINARGETAHEKPSFRGALKKRRCLVLADGFYEWQKLAGGKQPHYFRLSGGPPFAFAGLFEQWDKGEADEPLRTFTIITTAPNELVSEVHDRMPVILSADAEADWLDPAIEADTARGLLRSCPADAMETWPVSREVNSPRNDTPACIERLSG